MKKLINFIQFQAVWFLCIFGAAHQYELMAILISIGIIAWAILTSEHRTHDYVISLIAVIIGLALDSLLISQNGGRHICRLYPRNDQSISHLVSDHASLILCFITFQGAICLIK